MDTERRIWEGDSVQLATREARLTLHRRGNQDNTLLTIGRSGVHERIAFLQVKHRRTTPIKFLLYSKALENLLV